MQTKYTKRMQIIILLASLLVSYGERIITSKLGNYFKGEEVQFFTSEVVGFNINTIGQLQKEILDFIVEKLSEERIKHLLDQNAINKIHFASNYFQERGTHNCRQRSREMGEKERFLLHLLNIFNCQNQRFGSISF